MTIYYEEPCEHGRTAPHSWPVWPSGLPYGPPDEMLTVYCEGGTHAEISDVLAVYLPSDSDPT